MNTRDPVPPAPVLEPSAAASDSPLAKLKRRLDSQFASASEHLSAALAEDTATPLFPALPPYHGTWYPVYWTPIPGSGERITVLIVAKGDDGQVCMRSTISEAVLEVAFGIPKAAALRQMFDYLEKMLPDWLASWESGGSQAAGAVPITGFTLGPGRSSYADDLQQLAAQGICLDAAFATP